MLGVPQGSGLPARPLSDLHWVRPADQRGFAKQKSPEGRFRTYRGHRDLIGRRTALFSCYFG